MQEQIQIDAIGYMLSSFTVLFILLFMYGIGLKILSIISAILAYPTYVALFTFEFFSYRKKDILIKKLFRLNIPKTNPKRTIMNISASVATLMAMATALKLFNTIMNPELQISFIQQMGNGSLIRHNIAIVLVISILIIYFVSFFTENDERTAYDKIESLSMPTLWKKVLN